MPGKRAASAAVLIVAPLLVVAGCSRPEPGGTKVERVRPDPSTPAKSSAPPVKTTLDPVSFGAPGPVVTSPAVPPIVSGMMDHANASGWSADGEVFGYCQLSGGSGAEGCELTPRAGPVEAFDDWDDKAQDVSPVLHATLVARKKALALSGSSGNWAFARDLELTWDAPSGGTLRVGARVKGEAPSYAIVLVDKHRPDASMSMAHPEAIAVSPDGERLGVVAHTYMGEFSDWFLVETVPTARVAAMAYNDAGFAHHEKKDFAMAADLFAKATAADRTYALGAYNLACAYARLGDERARIALEEAIARAGSEGAATKKKALADEDFAAVKGAKWFVALVG